jgi:hypothetical protein
LPKEEFDVDMVCVINDTSLNPTDLLNLVLNRLKENPKYKDIVSLGKNKRNICLEFTKTFHFDIVPARKITDGEILEIPNYNKDTQLYTWRRTNPIGFKKWFFAQTLKQKTSMKTFANANDEFPDFKPFKEMKPLQHVVQLIKRWRDNCSLKESSILLTTLAGSSYDGEQNIFMH